MSKTYKIHSDDGWWNNDEGWCNYAFEGTTFSAAEQGHFRLPIAKNVRWVEAYASEMTVGKLLSGLE